MINLRNTKMAALATSAALGIGAVALPAASLAASHSTSKAKTPATHKTSTKTSTKALTRHDSSPDRPSVDSPADR